MAEFLTMDEAKSKFGTKGRTNAGLTLGIIGTSLPVKGHCAYSVFDVRVTPAPAPTAAIASVAKSK